MGILWEKTKITLGRGASSLKEGAKALSERISQKAPEIATAISEKSHEVVETGKLKIKLYNLKSDASRMLTEIGRNAYELMKKNEAGIYENREILNIIEDIKKLEIQIEEVESEIKQIRTKTITEKKEEKEDEVNLQENQ
jgi:ubiquinone biosynthesis protein UbiJ